MSSETIFHIYMHIFLAALWGSCGHILGVFNTAFSALILPVSEPCLDTCKAEIVGIVSAYYRGIYFEG